jgi:hypothetical protein
LKKLCVTLGLDSFSDWLQFEGTFVELETVLKGGSGS